MNLATFLRLAGTIAIVPPVLRDIRRTLAVGGDLPAFLHDTSLRNLEKAGEYLRKLQNVAGEQIEDLDAVLDAIADAHASHNI